MTNKNTCLINTYFAYLLGLYIVVFMILSLYLVVFNANNTEKLKVLKLSRKPWLTVFYNKRFKGLFLLLAGQSTLEGKDRP